MRLAQIVLHPAAPQIRPRQPVVDRVGARDDAYVPRAIHKDAVAREQLFRLIEIDDHLVAEFPHRIDPARRQIPRQPADACVARGEPRARQRLRQIVDLLPLRERVQEDRQRPHVHRERAQPQQMRRNPRQLAADHADVLAARWKLFVDAEELLHRQGVHDVVMQGREIIQPIGVRDELRVSHVLRDLLIAAMQITHVRRRLRDDLAIHLQQQPQHPVRRRMRRPHVQDHLLALEIAHLVHARRGNGRRQRRDRGCERHPCGGIAKFNGLSSGHEISSPDSAPAAPSRSCPCHRPPSQTARPPAARAW